jgi:hypothetical protein
VHDNVTFGYEFARPTKTAFDVYAERQGVCRDFQHLAITFLRALNVPARYATGYLGDIGVPHDPNPMDFSAWLEVYLGGAWHALDARHNAPRIGRLLMARGRDAVDVALTTSFGAPTSPASPSGRTRCRNRSQTSSQAWVVRATLHGLTGRGASSNVTLVMAARGSVALTGWRRGAVRRMAASRESTLALVARLPEREILRPRTQDRWSVRTS